MNEMNKPICLFAQHTPVTTLCVIKIQVLNDLKFGHKKHKVSYSVMV